MKKGFTLIELLIVIGILAILATTVVLVLNPAQILAESRDTQRVSDLGSVQSAVGLMLATDSTIPDFANQPRCTITGCTSAGTPTTCGGFTNTDASVGGTAVACVVPAAADMRKIEGSGWVGIDLSGTSGGSTLANLPMDPTNSTSYYYAYISSQAGAGTTYEIDARLESTKLRGNMTTDGGDDNTCTGSYVDTTCWYEVGSEPGLDL